MKVRIYGFHDRASQSFIGDTAGLVLFKHDAVAIRTFGDLCRQEGSIFAKHPQDYELISLGEFDTESGIIEAWAAPAVVATAAQVLEVKS